MAILNEYILDANTFITPYKQYYQFDFAPSYWKQFAPAIVKPEIKILSVVYDELVATDDELSNWIKSVSNLKKISIADDEIVKNYGKVLNYVRESGFYTERALRNWSDKKIADAWIIAAAMKYEAVIITFEQSVGELSTKNKTSKVKIPDVAENFGIECQNLFDFIRAMKIKL